MKTRLLLLTATLALAVPASAQSAVRLFQATSPVSPGKRATIVVAVSPAATCSIAVHYKTGRSKARGLHPKASAGGRVSWTWTVGTNTTKGRWPIVVACGRAGTLRTSFVVR